MVHRSLRLVSRLFVCSFAPAVLAQSADLSDNDQESDYPDSVATASTALIPVPLATLKLTTTASSDVAYAGDPFTSTATITNTSNVDAQNVRLEWLLDGLATTCGSAADTTCTFATIAAGTTQTVTRTIRVAAYPAT
ncbi:MAG TPA: hypothetical protein VH087_09375 [Thermoanaerobaculia bacterium]|jgi:uncharacterized repeat protein (TIGR01451 family)|nr:hypothetical protein [Thermoanaerobaculia bacterium]